MPRNSSGTYTLPAGNPVVTNTVIESGNWGNPTMADLGSALTDSLSRSGSGTMLAALKLTDGSQAAPGLSFNSEASSGLYRFASKDIRFGIGGVDILRMTDTGVTISQPLTVTGGITYADDQGITWGDGSLTLKGNSVTDVLTMAGILFDTAGGVRARGWKGYDVTKSGVQIGSVANQNFVLLASSAGAANSKVWDIQTTADGTQLNVRTLPDDLSSASNALSIRRSGAGPSFASFTCALGVGTVPASASYAFDVLASTADVAHWKSTLFSTEGMLGTASDNAYVNAQGGALGLRANGGELARLVNAGVGQPQLLIGEPAAQMPTPGRGLIELNGSVQSLIALVSGGTRRTWWYTDNAISQIATDTNPLTISVGSVGERARFINGVGTSFGVGYTPPDYGNGVNLIGVNAAAQPVFDLSVAGSRVATFSATSSLILLGSTGALPLQFWTNGASRAQIDSAGVFTYAGREVGWRNLPLQFKGGNYTCVAADRGTCIRCDVSMTVAIPDLGQDAVVSVYANASGVNVIPGSGATFRWGTGSYSTGTLRNIAVNGLVTFTNIGSGQVVVTGTGIT